MLARIHAAAGVTGFVIIVAFWSSTVVSELFGSHETIAIVKTSILWGMIALIPSLAIAGASGMTMGRGRKDPLVLRKKMRMPFIALNGLLVLVPSAFFLADRASAGLFDAWFYGVQAVELLAGATNLCLMGLNIRDGLTMTGRISGERSQRAVSLGAPVIEERDGGPLVAKDISALTDPDGQTIEIKQVVALCRCGGSKNKPYCDGSHSEIGFDSRPSVDRTPDEVRTYEGKQVTVHYNRLLCSHAGECGRRLKSVFDSDRKPWIMSDNGTPQDIIAAVKACPSGALRYSLPGEAPQHAMPGAAGISIEKDGPYRVVGIPLATPRLAEGASRDKYTLCRCGASKNKPYCDGTHSSIRWSG